MVLLEEMYSSAIKTGLDRKWHLQRAKRKATQSLLVHSLNVMSIADSLTGIIGGFDKDYMTILGAAFIHDAAKAEAEAQESLSTDRGTFFHKDSNVIDDGKLISILKDIGLKDDIMAETISLSRAMEETEGCTHLTDILKKPLKNPKLIDVVMLADELASIRELKDLRSQKIDRTLNKLGLHLYYYKVSVLRGILTQILHRAMIETVGRKSGTPVLYYPYGTLFVSKEPITDPTEDEILTAVETELKKFLSNIDTEKIGKAIFGAITQTVIVAPELLFVNQATIKAFWKFIGNQRFVQNPQLPPAQTRAKWLQLIAEKYHLDNSQLVEERFKEVRAVLYLTQIIKEVYNLSSKNEETKNLVLTRLTQELRLPKSDVEMLIPKLLKVSQITNANDGIIIHKAIVGSPVLSGLKRMELLESLRRLYMKITLDIFDKGLIAVTFPAHEIAQLLVREIEKPLLISYNDLATAIVKNYNNGKKKKTGGIACALCSSIPFEEAPSPLIGESEIFTNFVEGGTCLGGKNKIKICKLCGYEAKMRSIFIKKPEETLFVFPQVQIGDKNSNVWQQTIEHLLTAQDKGVRLLQDVSDWADIIVKGKLNDNSAELFKIIVERNKNWSAGVTSRYIEENYGSVEDFLLAMGITQGETKWESLEEASKAVAEGQIKLPLEVEKSLAAFLADTTKFIAKMYSPNFVIVMLSGLKRKKGKVEESDTSYYLRKMFLGALIARLFLASVTFSNIPLEIKFPTFNAGYLEVPRKIGLTKIYSELKINNWINLEEIDGILYRMASLILIEQILTEKMNIGKDTLFALSKELPGRTLNKYVQATGDIHNRFLVKLINSWAESDYSNRRGNS